MKRILPIIFIYAFLGLLFPQVTRAYNKPLIMPPTSEGPGFILPDSPFYFLDKLKQHVRLAFAFGHANKAKVYESIAGERLAEFRFELAKNNQPAADIALQGLRENTRNAADQLAQAQFSGFNVDNLAREINTNMKEHQHALDFVESQAHGEVKAAAAWAEETLTEAKAVVENELPKEDLDNEIRDDLIHDATVYAENTAESANALKTSLDILQQQASNAAKNILQKREIALQKAIAEKNDQVKKMDEALLANEKRKEDLSLALQAQAEGQSQEIAQKAQNVAKTIQTTQQIVNTPPDAINTILGVSTPSSVKANN